MRRAGSMIRPFFPSRHSGAMRSIELRSALAPLRISRFPDLQLHIRGLVLTHHPGMTSLFLRRLLPQLLRREPAVKSLAFGGHLDQQFRRREARAVFGFEL